MTITVQSSLPKEYFEKFVRYAEAHAEEDRQRKEEAETRNSADTLVYRTEKLIKDEGDKFTGDERQQVESALATLKERLAGSDVEAIRTATDALVTASQGFAQRLYEQASQQAPTNSSESASPNDDEVVDAEIVEDQGGAA
jgi:molecular chaperone DnaK